MRMKNPSHPGLSVRYDCLEPLGPERHGGCAQAWSEP